MSAFARSTAFANTPFITPLFGTLIFAAKATVFEGLEGDFPQMLSSLRRETHLFKADVAFKKADFPYALNWGQTRYHKETG